MMYNLNGTIPDNTLNLTASAACGIWAGQITRWDDPEILTHNPLINPATVAGKNITVPFRIPRPRRGRPSPC